MPEYGVDLHNHTPIVTSDYRGSLATTPRDIVQAAVSAGLDVYGVTDHFTADGVSAIAEAAEEVAQESGRRVLVLGGAELKVCANGDEAHVLAVFEATRARGAFLDLVRGFGMEHPVAPTPDLPSIKLHANPLEVCRAVEELGGIALIGHADRFFGEYRLIDSPMIDQLLAEPAVAAVELCHSVSHERLSGSVSPAVIACSDSHSCEEIGHRRSVVTMAELSFAALVEAFARHSAVPILGYERC
ncbi:MAG: PHP domain-containing protein [Coriobacteriia bacterium]|nr:PHP domain-containing protein [Coriobacteriia bacterium]